MCENIIICTCAVITPAREVNRNESTRNMVASRVATDSSRPPVGCDTMPKKIISECARSGNGVGVVFFSLRHVSTSQPCDLLHHWEGSANLRQIKQASALLSLLRAERDMRD